MTGSIPKSLQDKLDENFRQCEDLTSTRGSHSAIELLEEFGHTEEEATKMAPSFGTFLKACRGDYIPNMRMCSVGSEKFEVKVCLYSPKYHARFIQAAYGSFKLSPCYTQYLDPEAEMGREVCRQVMAVRDIAGSHSRADTFD